MPEADVVRSLFVTLRRGFAGKPWFHRRVVEALGLTKRHQCVEKPNNASIRGMLLKVWQGGCRLHRSDRSHGAGRKPSTCSPALVGVQAMQIAMQQAMHHAHTQKYMQAGALACYLASTYL